MILPIFLTLVTTVICDLTVETPYGKIEGFDYVTASGNTAEIFLGIPFAEPPIGDLRLEKPRPPSKWFSTLKAEKFGPHCVTTDPVFFPGNEDCLYLNIFRPKNPSTSGYPVIVWIHGGGFVFGDTELYGYKNISNNFVDQGIIFVSVTYRLGPWGFFSSGDSRIPGNLGLWDQTQALRFLQEILPSFGGDTDRITIMGHSAGSGSVSWLTASPESNDLFAQAIEMSGSVYCHWVSSSRIVTQWSRQFAEGVGCDYSSENLKNCLKKVPLEDFLAVGKNYPIFKSGDTFGTFTPRIDGDFLKTENFEDAFKAAPKKPTLMGLVDQEGLIMAAQTLPLLPERKPNFLSPKSQRSYSKADLMGFIRNFITTEENYKNERFEAARDFIDFYTEGENDSHGLFYFEKFTQFLSDNEFNIPMLREARLKSTLNENVYFYLYRHQLPRSLTTFEIDGTPHAAEWTPLFGVFLFGGPFEFTESDKKNQKNFIDVFVSFVKNGVPSTNGITFPKVGSDLKYVEITDEPEIKEKLFFDRLQFWDKLADKYDFDFSYGDKYIVPKNTKTEL